MIFYRTLMPFQVMSFDLDDTLYDNTQVIANAEAEFIRFVQTHGGITDFDQESWCVWKQHTAKQDPLLQEDVTLWRTQSLQALLATRQKSAVEIPDISSQAMQYFLHWRHQITVPTQSLEILKRLKQRYKLVAITNGNVDPTRIGLDHFDVILRGGEHGRAKPHADLFSQTARYFNIPTHQILHVGDNLITDVQGAMQAGCQSVWLNSSGKSIYQFNEARILPTIEMANLVGLLALYA